MRRRDFLRGAGLAGGLGLAGCLERLGFERRSALAETPLVEDRPDAVYVPAGAEETGTYGTAADGEYAVALSYTYPHRFWLVAGGRERVDVSTDDGLHLMATVWDVETRTRLPTTVHLDLRRDGESVLAVTPWPMLSQRMGVHYGDNVSLPGEGEYTARVRVGPVAIQRTGAFVDRFSSATTLEIDVTYRRSAIHDLALRPVEEERRGTPGALEPMAQGAHAAEGNSSVRRDDGGSDASGHGVGDPAGRPPPSRGPPIDGLPGRLLGTESSADARVSVVETDRERLAGESSYLAVCLRTPYNDVGLPRAALGVTVERDGETVVDAPLVETLDHELGHHYGLAVDALEPGDSVTVSVVSPPQVARHDGYETAFLDVADLAFEA